MSTILVSNFEVLFEPITPIPPTSSSNGSSNSSGGGNSGSGGSGAAGAPATMSVSQLPKRYQVTDDATTTFPVPQVIQGYFLLIGNPGTSPTVTPTIVVEADSYTLNLIVNNCFALTQIDGQFTKGQFVNNNNGTASYTMPNVVYGANFAIVGNYTASTSLDLRGNVYITVNQNATLVLNPQTRAIFTTGDATTPPGEVAYSMITSTGNSLFSFSSTASTSEFPATAKSSSAPTPTPTPTPNTQAHVGAGAG